MNWLELSLELDHELVEPAAELFSRYGAGAVIEPSEKHSVLIRTYVTDDADGRQRREQIERGLWHLAQISPYPDLQVQIIQETDWSRAWREHYQPLDIGEQLRILPAWHEGPDRGRTVVRMDPGMAFGTGTHPSTRLCLELIEAYVRPGDHVVDIGCGSGILSIAALRLGAQAAWAVDISQAAIDATRANAELNGVSNQLHAAPGSLEALQNLPGSPAVADLVVANILAPALTRLFEDGLAAWIGSATTLILSGILDEQLQQIEDMAASYGLQAVESLSQEDWRAVAYTRSPSRERDGL